MTAPKGSSMVRLVAVGDVGRRAAYHVGDEAMLLGLIETAQPSVVDVEWTVMSMDPPRTAADLGVLAVPRLTFEDCAGSAEREARLALLDRTIETLPGGWTTSAPVEWRESLAAIAACDGVVIAGGGNLNRAWPAEVFERTAVARAARRAGRPVAITSQTIGPSFDERTRELTAALVKDAVFVGLREASSHELAIELGAPPHRTRLQFDDATGVTPAEPAWWRGVAGDGPSIVVTLNQIDDPDAASRAVTSLARQLVDISERTGATVVLVPHVGDPHGPATHDVAMARALADAAGGSSRLRVAPLPTPAEAVWIVAHAELVISTRYHPIVFAIETGTPSLFLPQDHYTLVKGQGALRLAGLSSWTLPVAGAAFGGLQSAVLELWARRHEIREHLRQVTPTIAARRQQHVTDLVSALVSPAVPPSTESLPLYSGPVARGDWVTEAHDATSAFSAAGRLRTVETQLACAEDSIRALTAEVDRKQADLVVAQTALADLTKTLKDAHAEWLAERESLRRHCEALEARASVAERWAGTLAHEVERKEADLKIAAAALEETARRNS